MQKPEWNDQILIRCTEGVDEPDIIRKIIPGVGSYGSERKPIAAGPYAREITWSTNNPANKLTPRLQGPAAVPEPRRVAARFSSFLMS